MASSGSISFNLNRDQIIQMAYFYLQVYSSNETISPDDMAFANVCLNLMTKSWHTIPKLIWPKTEGVIFLLPSTVNYNLGDGANTYCCNYTNIGQATVSTAINISDTLLNITNTTNFVVGNTVGILLDTNQFFWTTIAAVPTLTSITVQDPLIGTAAINQNIFSYASTLQRPLMITSIRRVDSGNEEIPMELLTREQYFNLPNKFDTLEPYNWFYDSQTVMGTLYIYGAPQDSSVYLRLTYQRSLQDYLYSTNTPDFPQEWTEVIAYMLAIRMSSAHGKTQLANADLSPKAGALLKQLTDFNTEPAFRQFTPFCRGGR